MWDRTHALGGWLFKLTAVIALVGLAFGEYVAFGEYAVYFLFVPSLLTAVATAAYSYYLYSRLEEGTDSSPNAGL